MRIGTEAENITGLRLDSCAYTCKHANTIGYRTIATCCVRVDEIVNSYRSCECDHERFFLFFIFRGQIGQELFEMFKIDHDST